MVQGAYDSEDLIDSWTLTPEDHVRIAGKSRDNRLAFAVLLLFFRANGRFPDVAEIHPSIVALVAQQLGVDTGPIADQSVNVSLLGNTVRVPHPSRLLAAWEPRTFDRNQPYLA